MYSFITSQPPALKEFRVYAGMDVDSMHEVLSTVDRNDSYVQAHSHVIKYLVYYSYCFNYYYIYFLWYLHRQ